MEFGELRMLCQERPGSAAWRAILATIEAKHAMGGAHAEEAEQVWLPYADKALARWPHATRAITEEQIARVYEGQRVLTLRLARHLRWTGIWSERDIRTLAAQPDLITLPSLHLYQTRDTAARALITARPALLRRLETLRVESCFLEPRGIKRLLKTAARGGALRALDVDGRYAALWFQELALYGDRLPVESLRMRDGALREEERSSLEAWIAAGAARRLRALDLHCMRAPEGAHALLLDACDALTSLGLRAQDLPERDLLAALYCARVTSLHALHLDVAGLATEAVAPLGELLRASPELRALRLYSTFISTERVLAPPLHALGRLPAWLTDINVYDLLPASQLHAPGARPEVLRLGKLGSEDSLTSLLDAIDLSAVTALRLPNSLLGPERALDLARRELPALRHADLWGCLLGDLGVARLVEAPWSAQLDTLELQGNQIGAQGADALAAWLPGAALRQLALDSNQDTLRPAALAQLMEAATKRSAPLQLSAYTKTGPHHVDRICPPRADGASWPAHVQFAEIMR
jgi:hypothetical protein